jgi:hypothetical protein
VGESISRRPSARSGFTPIEMAETIVTRGPTNELNRTQLLVNFSAAEATGIGPSNAFFQSARS